MPSAEPGEPVKFAQRQGRLFDQRSWQTTGAPAPGQPEIVHLQLQRLHALAWGMMANPVLVGRKKR